MRFIDEAQFIKNPTSLGAKAVKAVQAKHRFALTGTPIENTLSELWSIFDFVMPGFLADIDNLKNVMRSRYCAITILFKCKNYDVRSVLLCYGV